MTSSQSPPPGPPGSETSLQMRAEELAGQIEADGRILDELSGRYESAQIAFARVSARQRELQRTVAADAAAVTAARQALKEQAILAYLAGGAPVIGQLPSPTGVDPSVAVSYAEIVAGGQKAAVAAYRATLENETREKTAVEANARAVDATLAAIRAAKVEADATLAAQRQALSEVKGQLAVAVAAVQAQRQAAAQARETAALRSAPPLIVPAPRSAAPAPVPVAATRAPATTRPVPRRSSPPTATARTTTPTTAAAPPPTAAPTAPAGTAQAPGASQVLAYARAQLGKPYQWGGAGPDSFDCSGLVMMAWGQAGISFPHLAQDQYNMTTRIAIADMVPGDLVFFGTPDNVYHVGIYIGNGEMIDAPETGQNVQIQSFYWDSLLGAGRVTSSS